MTKLTLLGAPYDYVHTENLISNVKELLNLDQALSGTDPASIVIAQEKSGTSDLLRLKGLGKDLWRGLDARDYIDKLRDEWEK